MRSPIDSRILKLILENECGAKAREDGCPNAPTWKYGYPFKNQFSWSWSSKERTKYIDRIIIILFNLAQSPHSGIGFSL